LAHDDGPPLADNARLAYRHYPTIGARCGKVEPQLFTVPDDEWEYYLQPDRRDEILCPSCYVAMRGRADKYRGKSRGKPNAEVQAAVKVMAKRFWGMVG
jgi:hypothetical protein